MFELFGFLVTIDLVEGWLEIVQSILKGHSLLSIKNQNQIELVYSTSRSSISKHAKVVAGYGASAVQFKFLAWMTHIWQLLAPCNDSYSYWF